MWRVQFKFFGVKFDVNGVKFDSKEGIKWCDTCIRVNFDLVAQCTLIGSNMECIRFESYVDLVSRVEFDSEGFRVQYSGFQYGKFSRKGWVLQDMVLHNCYHMNSH